MNNQQQLIAQLVQQIIDKRKQMRANSSTTIIDHFETEMYNPSSVSTEELIRMADEIEKNNS